MITIVTICMNIFKCDDDKELNPYYVLQVAPWATFSTIESKYKTLKTNNKDKKKLENIDNAFKKICEFRNIDENNKGNIKDNVLTNFLIILFETLKKSVLGILGLVLLYYVAYYIYTIYEELFIHLMITWLFKNCFETMLPHIFSDDLLLYFASVGVFLASIIYNEKTSKLKNLFK